VIEYLEKIYIYIMDTEVLVLTNNNIHLAVRIFYACHFEHGEMDVNIDPNIVLAHLTHYFEEDYIDANLPLISNILTHIVRDINNFGHIEYWDVSRVTNMSELFEDIIDFVNVNNTIIQHTENHDGFLSNWDVSNVTNMSRMFKGSNLDRLKLGNWDVSKVKDMSEMFMNATNLPPLENWNVKNVNNMSRMFKKSTLDDSLQSWGPRLTNLQNMSEMFMNCKIYERFCLDEWSLHLINLNNATDAFKSNISIETHKFPSEEQILFYISLPPNVIQILNTPENNENKEFAKAMQVLNGNAPFPERIIRCHGFKRRVPRIIPEIPTPENTYPIENPIQIDIAGPRPTTNQIAIAQQSHVGFRNVNVPELLRLIGEIPFSGTLPEFTTKVRAFLNELIENYSRDNKPLLLSMVEQLSMKIQSATSFSHEDNITLYNSAIEYVKRQPPEYQDNYIYHFYYDSTNSYDTGVDRSSCVKGIRERLILMLGNATESETLRANERLNQEYNTLYGIVYPSYTKQQLFHFISKCINPTAEGNIVESLTDLSIRERKEKIVECVLNHLSDETNPTIQAIE
jgi:surface protein